MARPDEALQVHFESPDQWRAWLLENAESESSVWLVSWRSSTGRPAIPYEDAVLHALSVGWVDSTQRRIDDERTALYFARRKPISMWSRPNKERVERLLAEGLMTAAGERAIEEAKQRGTWAALDEVEDLIVPEDLAAGFDAHPGSRERWDGFTRSQRRAVLAWIVQAKRPETRTRRIEETARLAAQGKRANEQAPEARR
jgi:uncharacterized protein YdeI (YjbR/CyaY-like superfamily)